NHFFGAIRAFLLWCNRTKRARDVSVLGVNSFNIELEKRHPRRALTLDELTQLIEYSRTGPIRYGMPGPLRAMAYLVSAGTGFGVGELSRLTPESFRLDGDEPFIVLAARNAKNRRPVEQEIKQSLADELRQWLKGKPARVSVFPLHHETAQAMRADLEAI